MEREYKLLQILNKTSNYLSKKGIENPRLTSEILLGHVLRLNRIDLYLQHDRPLCQSERSFLKELVEKRLKGVPIQYITGKTEFMSLPFLLNSSVAIPRPETEILVQKSYEKLMQIKKEEVSLADIGTGCGVIAVSLAHMIDKVCVYATDISTEAVKLSQKNAQKNKVAEKVVFLQGDLFKPLNGLEERFDAIISNPPYLKTKDIPLLPEEVKDFEPILAFDGGKDGLYFYRRLISQAPNFLEKKGIMALEVGGRKQAEEVSELFQESNFFNKVEKIKDLNKTERVLIGERMD